MNQSAARVLTGIAYFLLILCATIIPLLIIFSSQLDLNNYRLSLEQKISSALEQPVSIGHSSLTYNHGLALEFQQVQIGPDHAILAQIPQITATLEIVPLFKQKIVLSQVQIEKPDLQLWLPFSERPAKGISHHLLNSLGITLLTVHNANLKIYQKQGGQKVKRLEFSNLHAVLKGWKPGEIGHLVVAGEIPEYTADFLLETSLSSSIDPQISREEEHQLQLQINRLSTAKLPKLPDQKYPEAFNLHLELQGVPANGTDFSTILTGSGSNEQIFSLSGRWTSLSNLDSITQLTGKLLKIPLNGEFFFIRQAKEYSLYGKFGAEDIKLTPELLKAWRIPNAQKLLKGDLDQLTVTLKKTWDPTKKTIGLPQIGAETTISNLDWDIPELKQIQDFSAEFSLENQTLHIKDGILVAGGYVVDFSGGIKNLFLTPKIDLIFKSSPDIGIFKSQLKLPEQWNVSGDIPGTLSLTGSFFEPEFLLQVDLGAVDLQLGELFHKQSTDQARLQMQGRLSSKQFQLERFSLSLNETSVTGDLQLSGHFFAPEFLLNADLGAIELQFGELFHKLPTDQAKLQLQGNLSGQQLQLEHFSLTLNDLRIAGSGSLLQNQAEPEYHFSAEPISLDKLKYFSPLLRELQVRGEIKPAVSRQQKTLTGTLGLNGVGAHLTDVIADLNNATGQINFDRQGFTFQKMKASLGESEFTVSGKLSHWEKPQLELNLSGKKIRARDLVFPHSQLTFSDLNGQLQIDAERLTFSPVTVQLEKNTQATVTGQVSNFKDPHIFLDIQSEQVAVLDIINLFTNPDQSTTQISPPIERPPLLINVSAKQGTLGGLHFQQAETLITGENERLTIYPLKFASEEGWCKARVEVDYQDQLAPLKISGHMHKLNATTIHRDMFHKPGLIKGSLTGDFYIEGNPGHNLFWQYARGGIHMRVKKGVLREFHTLAKVFSLLNISQIFTGNLPDMDKEGMPFTLLESSFKIGDGKVTTNDLTITSESMNLSAVGSHNLVDDSLDITLGVMPLRTVDKIITSVPVAGWVLTGENKALLTAYFKVEGTSKEPEVSAIPVGSVSETIFGLFNRIIGLPVKLIQNIGSLFEEEPEKKVDP